MVAARTVGSPTDPAEHEAERVARAVFGVPPGLHHDDAPVGPITPAVRAGIAAARGRGRPLPGDVRARMESALGADLGEVRLHAGPVAAGLTRALAARAFTAGTDVFLGNGQYPTDSSAARGVLGHELTHVVQQQADPDAPIRRVLHPQYLNRKPTVLPMIRYRDNDVLPALDGTGRHRGRAAPVEAIIPGTGKKQGDAAEDGPDARVELDQTLQRDGPGQRQLAALPPAQRAAQRTGRRDPQPGADPAGDQPEPRVEGHGRRGVVPALPEPKSLHFIASVDYHPVAQATAAHPGLGHQHFFPRRIEGQYRIWDAANSDWVPLDAPTELVNIGVPPTDAAVVPVDAR